MTNRTNSDIPQAQAKPTATLGPIAIENRRRRTLAALRQAIWEASQFSDCTEIEIYCDDVLKEIRSDNG